MCAKIFLNPIKSRSKQCCYLANWPWTLNLSSFNLFASVIFNFFDEAWPLVRIIFVPSPFALYYFWHQSVYYNLRVHYYCNVKRNIWNFFCFIKELLLFRFVDCPPSFSIIFVTIFNFSVFSVSMFIVCWYASVLYYSSISISISLLALAPAVMD